MTNGGSNEPRPSKNQRRDAAREKARELREKQKKRDRRNRVFLQGGIGLVVVAIVAVVVVLIVGAVRPAGPGPANMASDGIVIGENMVPQTSTSIAADETPVPSTNDPASGVVDIRVYLDYLCPYCGQFETTNAEQIKEWVTSGAATLEVHPIAILTSRSNGTKYSERAANAAACVANSSPESFFDFNSLLFANQPEEGSNGLTDDELAAYAVEAGATSDAVASCISDKTYVSWVRDATSRALDGPLPGTDLAAVNSTPTVLVNGKQYSGSLTDPSEFNSFVIQAAGDSYATATPTPTPAG